MTKNNSIGIFDSGVGGISIWKEIHKLLPQENTIYLADSKNAPYGNRTSKEIIDFSIKNTKLLIEKGCKVIVVACNTATTNAIHILREKFEIPFIGIEPAIKPAALNTISGKIGILATKGTFSSTLFSKTSKKFANNTEIIEVVGKGLVALIESGDLHSNQLKNLLNKYLKPMIENKVDYIVLGCTHYPFLMPLLKELLPPTITIIDSGKAVAKQTQSVLKESNLLNNERKHPKLTFYSNSDPKTLKQLLELNSKNMTIQVMDF